MAVVAARKAQCIVSWSTTELAAQTSSSWPAGYYRHRRSVVRIVGTRCFTAAGVAHCFAVDCERDEQQ